MANTESTMAALGMAAPDFTLPDPGGRTVSLGDFADAPGLLVVFMCNHCPFVKHIREELGAIPEAAPGARLGCCGHQLQRPRGFSPGWPRGDGP